MPKTVLAEMEVTRAGDPLELLLEGTVCGAEPEVGIMRDYVDDVTAYDEEARVVRLTEPELERATDLLNERLDA